MHVTPQREEPPRGVHKGGATLQFGRYPAHPNPAFEAVRRSTGWSSNRRAWGPTVLAYHSRPKKRMNYVRHNLSQGDDIETTEAAGERGYPAASRFSRYQDRLPFAVSAGPASMRAHTLLLNKHTVSHGSDTAQVSIPPGLSLHQDMRIHVHAHEAERP